ncbi:MAG: phosphotransferase [Rhodocyclaceae bacterium]|nr:phosphotransferase [Rhodocyclaceae bacterium]
MTQDSAAAPLPTGGIPFDVAALGNYLKKHLEGFSGALEVSQFQGGQSNPTFRLAAGGRRYVLRKKPPGELLPSAHAIDREFRVISALAGSDVPVPRTFCYCDDPAIIGTAFYVTEFVDGRIFYDPALPGMAPTERAEIFDAMNRVVAALHRVDYKAVGLADYGKTGNYFERQIARWSRQYRASETERLEAMERLMDWLPKNIPSGDATTIVHGDLRLDNLIFHPTEARVLAVLDWELSTLGHPLADFSYNAITWRLQPAEFRGLAGHDLAALGIPDEEAYVAAYCRRTGRAPIPPDDWDFYCAYNMFRLAAILQGIMARAVGGNASNHDALEVGRRAKPIGEAAWRQVERILARH